jgi:hypothetical protein
MLYVLMEINGGYLRWVLMGLLKKLLSTSLKLINIKKFIVILNYNHWPWEWSDLLWIKRKKK